MVLDALLGNQDVTLVGRTGNDGATDTRFAHQLFESLALLHLYQDTRILGEENLDDVLFCQRIEIDFQTTLYVGEAHLQHGCDHTTCRNVVTCQNQALFDSLLQRIESRFEIVRILHGRNLVTQLVQRLCKGRSAQLHGVEREVDIINVRILFVSQYRRDDLLHVTYLRTCRDDYSTRCNDLVVTILLGHGE